MRLLLLTFVSLLVRPAAAQPGVDPPAATSDQAALLARQLIIADGHVDLPTRLFVRNFRLERTFTGIPITSTEGDFDYTRAKRGGLDAPFMSIYVPSSYQTSGDAKAYADSLIEMIGTVISEHPDKFAPGLSPSAVEENFAKGLISLPMGMENGAPIREIQDVAYFHARGIRYVTLTHAKDNQICDSSYDTTRTWNGLSPFGRLVIAEMNRVGMMVDISHVTDAAFYQALGISQAPVIASHSSCRTFTPGFQRNMSDDMIQALGKNGGVILINFGSDFLDRRHTRARDEMRAQWSAVLAENGWQEGDSAAQVALEEFRRIYHDQLFSDVEVVADHIDHAVSLAGIDHVGLGSDFDGVGDSLPAGLKDVADYPNLLRTLLERGYTTEDLRKICWGNLARVWRQVERVSAALSAAP